MPVHIVAGGQFGSEGKGAFTAALTRQLTGWLTPGARGQLPPAPALVRVAGPNAGHTAYDHEGNKWSLRQIPVGAVVNEHSPVVIGQGSEIQVEVLFDEIRRLESAGIPIRNRLVVDRMATVIQNRHQETEVGITTGTTGKGIGAARADRLLRQARLVTDSVLVGEGVTLIDTVALLRSYMRQERDIIIEGTQGYGLGLHTRFYPYTTSSNCRPGDFLAMTGLQPWECNGLIPWLVFRANPIRIAGNSGPLEDEITWEEVGQPVELTTVTQKPRRVATWDQELAEESIINCGGGRVRPVYMFLDYDHPEVANTVDPKVVESYVLAFRDRTGINPWFVGTGPQTGVWRPQNGWGNTDD